MRSFVNNKNKTDEAASVATATAPEPRQPSSSTTTALSPYNNSTYFEGETTSSDIKKPYLSCVQGVGPKSAIYTPGTVLIGDSVVFTAPDDPRKPTEKLRIMFCKAVKAYVENLKYDSSPTAPRPRVYRTKAEVVENGGTLEYQGNVAPTFVTKLTSSVLVRQPRDNNDEQFCFMADDHSYAPTMLSFQKTGYSAAKVFLTDMSLSLKNDPTVTFYDIFWSKELKGTNWVYVPKLVRVRDEKPSDTVKIIANKVAGTNVEQVEEEGAV